MSRKSLRSWVFVAGGLLLTMVGLSTNWTRAQTKGGRATAQPAAGTADASARLCYEFDPQTTQIGAISDGRPYCGLPPALGRRDELQGWSGYCPECELNDRSACERLPCQTANIKVSGQYEEIEVGDNEWMQMACDEARRSVEAKGGPFGAVIVQIDDQRGTVIRYWRNHNHVVIWNDPTAHAEVTTIRAVCKELGVFDLGRIEKEKSRMPQEGAASHCEIYSSAEPCPMCFAAIAWARIPTLVFAATRYDASAQGVNFSDEAIYAELEKPYRQREMKVLQSSTPGSLDAFNRWKRMKKVPY